eukprot:TRINITY_DN13533_c0_g1_i1.p2 TRINITY_DN13533_c0_g1~~TRINITY_DN13533_c0_g1_i1.p2  ORF type:complete len:141 (+),score=15.32 TRINITY_DN13533_c0_g1_i1:50-472(+)
MISLTGLGQTHTMLPLIYQVLCIPVLLKLLLQRKCKIELRKQQPLDRKIINQGMLREEHNQLYSEQRKKKSIIGEQGKDSPGVGSYNLTMKLNSKKYSIPSAKRIYQVVNQNPGPGNYQLKPKFADYPKYLLQKINTLYV